MIGKLLFLYVNVGLGLHQFNIFSLTFLTQICFCYNFRIPVKRLYNPKTFDIETPKNERSTFLLTLCVCVCVCVNVCAHAPIDVHVVGGVVACAALSSGGTYRLCQCNSVGDTAAVCTASSHFLFLENVISSLAASLHMGSLHPAVVFIITAVFVFFCFVFFAPLCSSGCT